MTSCDNKKVLLAVARWYIGPIDTTKDAEFLYVDMHQSKHAGTN